MSIRRVWLPSVQVLLAVTTAGLTFVACASSSHGGAVTGGDGGHGGDSGGTSSSGGSSSGGSSSGGGSSGSGSSSGGGGEGGTGSPGTWVMGYYVSWRAPANGGNYGVTAIDWDGLTHVATAFYLPDGKGGWGSGSFDNATASSLIAAAHAKGKKVLASIGGSGSGPAFEQSMQNASSAFVTALEALITSGYDGIDIDWEGGSLSASQDQALQSTLITSLRQKSPNIIITLTAGYENENSVDDLSWYGKVAPQLDRINVMTYGMAGAYSGWQSWHSAPLHWNKVTSTPTGIDATMGHYAAAGVPAAKLGIGIGFYGMCYTSPVTAPVQALGSSQVAADDQTMTYPVIMASYYSQSAYHYDSTASVPYLTLSGQNAQKCTYVTYDDPTSIAAKGAFVKAQGYGGAIIWEIGEGFVSSGSTVQAQNPLLEATKTGFLQ
jgi:chitinase